ncbi:penicillin acylase family protein [Piscinibacter sp. XHJ-5]|uniref:penicillin acylase family protein n=1 Tax=Piscinibacter sp. XHJ-5 TaxID=3037797 RepID=UPI0024534435|nr:penicillin acylase family protein [Piscinibacter sp. XHJ-5]
MKWLRRVAFVLVLLLALAAAAAWLYARQTLPQTDGSLRLAGPRAEIRIERDADGIPRIQAASLEDAVFGLGFVHAQDRLWQLETHRRIGAGRLAEAFGEAALDNDRFLRALGVQRAAAAQWAQASPQAKAVLTAYADGINAYLRDAMKARPPEFVLLGLTPEPWTPQDSMAWAIMMAWDLGGNWSTELLRMRLALKLPVARIDELIPPYPGEKPLVTADYAALFRELRVDGKLGQQALAFAPESGVEGIGSNNWVLAGSRTTTGKPLLANDPHLKLSAPALWYLARLEAPGVKVAGATMPGLPGVVLGQNEHVAWGFTNTGPDVQDLYLERIKPDDAAQYQTPDGWARFETFDEVIKVKGKPDVTLTARATRHGPVISDAGRVAEGLTGPAAKPAYVLAMRWTALDADSGVIDTSIRFGQARSVPDFIAASTGYTAPMQNMVVADREGHIGFVAAGRVPLRRPDNDLRGLVPAPGWEARYDWAGSVDAGQTPREVDPARGWIATANQRIHGTDYAHYIGNEWALPYRQQRIEQLLAATPRHSMASLATMHGDVVSLATRRLLPFLQKAQSTHVLAAAARKELADFDGTMSADRAAPLIFWAWTRHLAQGLFADEIGAPLFDRSGRSFRDAMEAVLERNDAWWCDDKTSAAVESCEQQIGAAFTRALDELNAAQGPDVAAWRWGRAHVARSEHRPFSRVKPLARWFELRTPVGGDTYTINVSRVGLRPDNTTGELYLDEHGPSLRALYDLGDLSQSRVMQSSGQSGIVFSPLYRSFVERWARVEYVPLWGGKADKTLVLLPGS